MEQEKNHHLVGLDILRMVAALGVVVFHLCYVNLAPIRGSVPTNAFASMSRVAGNGWVGVDIFFVLSGYVIAYSTGNKSASGFAKSRFLRLVPTAAICAFITALVMVSTSQYTPSHAAYLWLRSVVFLPGPMIDGSYWTLPVEVTFYFVVFVLLLTKNMRRLNVVAAALGGGSLAYWGTYIWAARLGQLAGPQMSVLTQLGDWSHLLLLYGSSFAVGVLLFAYQRGRRGPVIICGAVMSVAGTLTSLVARSPNYIRDYYLHSDPWSPLAIWMGALIWIAGSAKMDMRLRRLLTPRGVKIGRFFGNASYPLYLVHHYAGWTLEVLIRPLLGPWPALLVAFFAVIGAAASVFMFESSVVAHIRN